MTDLEFRTCSVIGKNGMNNRIRNFAEIAEFTEADFIYQQDNFHKMTELIIDECIDWINHNVGPIDTNSRADLFRHFSLQNTPEGMSKKS